MPQYQSVITLLGQAKVADALANGPSVNITQLSAGDGNGAPVTPLETQVALVHEVWRGDVLSASRDPANPTHVIVQAVIPVGAGPFTIRELALWTSDGQCFAVMNTPEIVKTTEAQGATQDITVSFRIVVDTAANITVTMNPAGLTPVSSLLRAPFIAIDGFVTAPPANPAAGALYVVGAAPTGAFVGLAHKFVQWNGTVWVNAVAIKDTIVGDSSTGKYWRRTATGWAEIELDIWIRTDTALTVGPAQQYATIQGAIDALKYKLAAPGVKITLQLTAGQHTITEPIVPPRLNGAQLIIKGAEMLGAFPVSADIVASAATTLGTLRAKFATEIVCNNSGALQTQRMTAVRLDNLLFSCAVAGHFGIVAGDSINAALGADEFMGGGQITAKNVWAHGFVDGLWARQISNVSFENIGVSHSTSHGVVANNAAYLVGKNLQSHRNGDFGVYARDDASVEVTGIAVDNNVSDGLACGQRGRINAAGDGANKNRCMNNGGWGLKSNMSSTIAILALTVTGNGGGCAFAGQSSYVSAPAGSNTLAGTISPAANTNGNQNSYVYS